MEDRYPCILTRKVEVVGSNPARSTNSDKNFINQKQLMYMNLKKIVFASLLYVIWSVLIGYFIPILASWAAIISALAAGIYVGRKDKAHTALISGFLAGLIGGMVHGVITTYTTSISGIPLEVSMAAWLTPLLSVIKIPIQYFAFPALAIVGLIFGTIGGLVGSREKMKRVIMFLTMFTLFLFYAALDNVAWWWGRREIQWSVSVVLTHYIDISMALIFAFIVTILAYVLKLY